MKPSFALITLLMIFTSAIGVSAQWSHLLHKTYAQRFDDINKVYVQTVSNRDSASAFAYLGSMKKFAAEHGDRELEMEADLLKAYYLTYWYPALNHQITPLLELLITRASDLKSVPLRARSYKVLGDYYWAGMKNYELGFETFIRQEGLLNRVDTDVLPDKAYHLANIAHAYHNFSDYKQALSLFRQILTLKFNPDMHAGHNSALYSIGVIYRQQGSLDSSDHYFKRILRKESAGNFQLWEAIARGGLGENAYLRGHHREALPLLQANIDEAVRQQDWGLAAESLIIQANIFLIEKAFEKSEQLALRARRYLNNTYPDRYKHFQDLYPIFVKIYAASGKPDLAAVYLDSALVARDSITNKYNAKLMLRAHQKIELQEHRAAMDKAESDKKLKTTERNLSLLLVLIVAGGSWYVYATQRKRHQQEQHLKELEIRQKEQELENAALQLNEFARNISEKSRQIEVLESRQGPDAEALTLLRASTILTQEDWDYFKKLFGKVHGDYLHRLRKKFPDLTQGEIRFIALAKLGLGYQEMSATLGISSHAVRTTKYRLLKKIDVPDDRSLEELVMEI
ncbi:MAG: hypothetical protein BGO21_14625 [Dyadobacter sp. 50-39]|uniref:hypothetical protein n=1 Tax=Dyadobacter sp. 50-39 TaxID=1895756 RepID=UPI00095BB753|nr:hypothetical protein [Dyadobacter sp. 50-39]OJV18044.1 MAG: hypothetical protein BGO21_14625 [Dyadobacter sp. 50-39]